MTSMKNLLCVTLLAAGCGSSVAVDNDNPLGVVGGIVLSAGDEAPLSGATVKITAPGASLTATTGADGTFVVQRVPSGGIVVEISNMGYVTARFTDFLSGSVGNFPVKNPTENVGVIGLIRASNFNVRVVDETGGPTPNVNVTVRPQLRFIDYSQGGASARGTMSIQVKTDGNGLAAASGTPDYASIGGVVDDTIFVDVAPVKVMGTEAYEFLGITQSFRANHLGDGNQAPTIVLAGPHTSLAVMNSNLPYIRPTGASAVQITTVPAAGPINIEFNQAIDPKTVRAQFYQEDVTQLAAVQPGTMVLTNILVLTPMTALSPGTRYNVLIHAQSLNAQNQQNLGAGAQFDTVTPMFVGQAAGVTPAIATTPAPSRDPNNPSVLNFWFNEPVGLGQASQVGISCIAFYEQNLDNGMASFYPGEYGSGPLSCPSQFQVPPNGPPYAVDITAIRPVEQTGGGIITGFTNHWQVTVGQGASGFGCNPQFALTSCIGVQSGNKAHLVFNHTQPGVTIRRVTGEPLIEDQQKLVFNVP
jgi:Carboxypeptidase regulatory-like domain/Bacterial Ig-like domain